MIIPVDYESIPHMMKGYTHCPLSADVYSQCVCLLSQNKVEAHRGQKGRWEGMITNVPCALLLCT